MEGRTPPVQVAQCQDQLGHKYRSGMQQPSAGSTRACKICIKVVSLYKMHLIAASHSYTYCVQFHVSEYNIVYGPNIEWLGRLLHTFDSWKHLSNSKLVFQVNNLWGCCSSLKLSHPLVTALLF